MFEDLMNKANDLMHNEQVKGVVDKAKDFVNSEKGKEVIENVKEKVEDFVKDKISKK